MKAVIHIVVLTVTLTALSVDLEADAPKPHPACAVELQVCATGAYRCTRYALLETRHSEPSAARQEWVWVRECACTTRIRKYPWTLEQQARYCSREVSSWNHRDWARNRGVPECVVSWWVGRGPEDPPLTIWSR